MSYIPDLSGIAVNSDPGLIGSVRYPDHTTKVAWKTSLCKLSRIANKHSSMTVRFKLALAMLTVTVMAGCISAPPYETSVQLPVPDAWPAGQAPNLGNAQPVATLHWRDYFSDDKLQGLIEIALLNNRDLRTALLRVEEARAAYGIQRADQFPTIGVGAQGARGRIPGDKHPTGMSAVSGDYQVYAGLSSWELDLWGRVRSLKDAALQEYLASEATQHAVYTALIAEVANTYLGLRELDERTALARQTIASREESYRIFLRRNQVGSTSALDLAQVETLLIQAQALGAQLEQARATQKHALLLLLGTTVDVDFDTGKTSQPDIKFADLDIGLPADILTNRPDIVAAEHRLIAAHANIHAARMAFLPRIALTGNLGTASVELNGLFDSGSRAWAFMPTISLPIFDGGRRRSGLDLAEVRNEIAVAEYEKTIQNAFREVSDALSASKWLLDRVEIQQRALQAQTQRARLAQLRYDSGASAFLEVLDAQRDLLDAQQQLVQVRRNHLSSQVALYAALGGGSVSIPSLPTSP